MLGKSLNIYDEKADDWRKVPCELLNDVYLLGVQTRLSRLKITVREDAERAEE